MAQDVAVAKKEIQVDSLRSSTHSPAGEESRLPAVHLEGNYFSHDGRRFIPVGANWVPAIKAMQI